MTWERFYDRYSSWQESSIKTCISALADIGTGDEVVDVVLSLSSQELKEQLVRKALALNVSFSLEDFANLDGELSDSLYARVANHGGFYFDNPHFDPNDFDWDEFYMEYMDMPKQMLKDCINKIKDFGPGEEIVEVILDLEDEALAETLYKRARKHGVRFTYHELEQLEAFVSFSLDCEEENVTIIDCTSGEDIFSELGRAAQEAADAINNFADEIERQPKKKKLGFWGALALLFGSSDSSTSSHHSSSSHGGWSSQKKRDTGRCDGDCANCPAHYGYLYGRWYYGHGHQHGCQRGGNGGASGKCYRD